jgi:hypothetical protein
MKKILVSVLVACLALAGIYGLVRLQAQDAPATLLPASEESHVWTFDYAKARQEAQARKKPLLLYFGDTRICPPCRRLHAEIFETEVFTHWASATVIAVSLDAATSTLPPNELMHLYDLYHIEPIPVVLLVDPATEHILGEVSHLRSTSGKPADITSIMANPSDYVWCTPAEWVAQADSILAKPK